MITAFLSGKFLRQDLGCSLDVPSGRCKEVDR